MPGIQAPSKILVTGGSGFIGSWVIRQLLERGYEVRATVRSLSKGKELDELFREYAGMFEFVIIPDIELTGAFDNVLEDIHGVQHIASPLTGNPDEFVEVAVNGTTSLLKSIVNNSVRRVVMTSSAGALLEPKSASPPIYTESDWNYHAIKAFENRKATVIEKYYASKTLAEQAAWSLIANKKFDLVTLLPTLVIGPVIHQVSSKRTLSYPLVNFYDGIIHEKASDHIFGNWVDVRDVAAAHILVMEREEASGQRLIVSAGVTSWQLIYDTLNNITPPLGDIPRGQPEREREALPLWTFESDKLEKLGLRYMTLAESTRDSVISMREHGWPSGLSD